MIKRMKFICIILSLFIFNLSFPCFASDTINNDSYLISYNSASSLKYKLNSLNKQIRKNEYQIRKIKRSNSLSNNEIITIPPTFGDNALLGSGIAVAIVLILFMVAVFFMFGDFGWLINLSLILYAVLVICLMQSMPIFSLSISGIIGSIVGLALLFASYCVIFGNIKKGYAEGKKIPLAVRAGYKKSILTVVDINVIAFIMAVITYFAGGFILNSFAIALGICSALNIFVSLLVTRWFTKWYLSINSI